MFYVYVQDYYGNTTAAQYVQVSFDATGGGLYKKVSFEDGKKITRRLVVKEISLQQNRFQPIQDSTIIRQNRNLRSGQIAQMRTRKK